MWLKHWSANKNWRSRECQNKAGVARTGRSCTWQATRRSSSSWRPEFMYSPHQYPQSNTEWESRLSLFKDTPQYRELDGLDGEAVQLMRELNCTPEDFPGSITFMSMFNDIMWRNKENELTCLEGSTMVIDYARSSARGRWSSLGPGSETKWNATDTVKTAGECDRVAELMVKNFNRSDHPIFRGTSALDRGQLKSKGGGRKSVLFFADAETIETIFRSIVSADQHSIYGAVADRCEDFHTLIGPDKTHVIEELSESMVVPTDVYDLQKPPTTN